MVAQATSNESALESAAGFVIRDATVDDLDVLVTMANTAYLKGPMSTLVGLDMAVFREQLSSLLGDSNRLILVVDDAAGNAFGILVAGVVPASFVNQNQHIASDLICWIEPRLEWRDVAGRLLDRMHEWATAKGCRGVLSSTLARYAGDINDLYKQRGFDLVALAYMKPCSVEGRN